MSKVKRLTAKEESYAQNVVLNGGDKVKAYESAGYSMNMATQSICTQADKIHRKPHVNLRIVELQEQADKVAKEVFTISVEQRLEWLKEIAEAGLSTYEDQGGNKRRENLTASTGAIKTMNEMIGVSDESSENAPSLEITFQVKQPVKEVKITNAKP